MADNLKQREHAARKNHVTVLLFRMSFNKQDSAELANLFRCAHEAGWQVQEIEFGMAAQIRHQLADGGTSVDVKSLIEFWRPAGCIVECAGRVPNLPIEDFGGIPVVFLDCQAPDAPRRSVAVHNDSAAVAEAAARELLALGFGDYAYLPYTVEKETRWSRERCECFVKLVRMNGKRFHAGPDGLNMSVEAEIPMTMARWLERIPRPCGVFAANDKVASYLIGVCAMMSIPVPDEIAILGVDDDEHICENLPISLSSVRLDLARAGALAVELLARRMSCPKNCPPSASFGVERVCRRASTRLFPDVDRRVVKALEFIRLHARENVPSVQIAELMGVSRRFADKLFLEAVGQTVFDALRQTRIERVKDMLATHDCSLVCIADTCGYRSLPALCREFKGVTGFSMREWCRKQCPSNYIPAASAVKTPLPKMRDF